MKASSPAQQLVASGIVAIRQVNNGTLEPIEKYPANPDSSLLGIAGFGSGDGRSANVLSGSVVDSSILLTKR